MDGTIIDSDGIWHKVSREVITSKVILPEEELHALEAELKGLALHASCKLIKDKTGLEHAVEHLIQEHIDGVKRYYANHITFIDGFVDFHKKVIDKNLKVSIATNAEDQTLQVIKDKLGLHNYFGTHIYNITDVNFVHKPAPDLYLHAAKKLGLEPHECIAIEDSTHGINAAVAAGMFCIGINTGKDHAALSNADMIIEGYNDLCLINLQSRSRKTRS